MRAARTQRFKALEAAVKELIPSPEDESDSDPPSEKRPKKRPARTGGGN